MTLSPGWIRWRTADLAGPTVPRLRGPAWHPRVDSDPRPDEPAVAGKRRPTDDPIRAAPLDSVSILGDSRGACVRPRRDAAPTGPSAPGTDTAGAGLLGPHEFGLATRAQADPPPRGGGVEGIPGRAHRRRAGPEGPGCRRPGDIDGPETLFGKNKLEREFRLGYYIESTSASRAWPENSTRDGPISGILVKSPGRALVEVAGACEAVAGVRGRAGRSDMRKRSGPDGPTAEAVPRRNLREELTARILAAIFRGRLASGQRLVVQTLAELYGVSPTPVRESLVELAAMGMVELSPNRGGVVLPFGPEQVREISQVRRVLEVEATRCACGRADPRRARRAAFRAGRAPGPPQGRPPRPGRARLRQPAALDDRRLLRQRPAPRRGRAATWPCSGPSATSRHLRDAATNYARSDDVPEHLDILDGLLRGDAEAAVAAMDRHLRLSSEALEDVLFSAADRPADAQGGRPEQARRPSPGRPGPRGRRGGLGRGPRDGREPAVREAGSGRTPPSPRGGRRWPGSRRRSRSA